MKWFDEEVGEGENGIVIYPNLQTFRQIYTKYVKDQLAKEVEEEKEDDNNSKGNGQLSKPRIMLIATFYETIDSVKHSLSAVGVKGIQSLIDNGSLVIVDAFSSYYPDVKWHEKAGSIAFRPCKKREQKWSYCHSRHGLFLSIWWRRQSYRIDKL